MKIVYYLTFLMIFYIPQLDGVLKIQTADEDELIFRGEQKKALMLSITIKEMLEDIDEENDDIIPLPNISTATLNNVIEHLTRLLEDHILEDKEKEEKKQTIIKILSEYSLEKLKDFIEAVNFLNIPDLLYFACKAWSNTYEIPCFINNNSPLSNPGIQDILKDIRLEPLIDFFSVESLKEKLPLIQKKAFNHREPVTNFCISNDGSKIACVTANEIYIWDTINDISIKRALSHFFFGIVRCNSIDFHPNNNLICFALTDLEYPDELNFFVIWNITNQAYSTYRTGKKIYTISCDPIGENIALGGRTKIRIFNSSAKEYSQQFAGQHMALDLKYNPENTKLACCSADGKIYIWELSTGKIFQKLQTQGPVAQFIRYSPDGKLIATSSRDFIIRLWNADNGNCLHKLIPHKPCVRIGAPNISFRPDGKILASSLTQLCLSNVATGEQIAQRIVSELLISINLDKPTSSSYINSPILISYKPDENNTVICAGYGKKTLKIWDLNSSAALGASNYDTVGLFHALCKEKKEKNEALDLGNEYLFKIFNSLSAENQDLLCRMLTIKGLSVIKKAKLIERKYNLVKTGSTSAIKTFGGPLGYATVKALQMLQKK